MEDGRQTPEPAPARETSGEVRVGRFLEHTRKKKGLSLEEAEQATKIRKRYLAGLESEDYGVLPDAVYAQGFLKTYANFLGLDGEALCRELKSRREPRHERGIDYETTPHETTPHETARPEVSDLEEPLISPRGLQGTEKRNIPTSAIVTLLVAALVLAAVIGALYFVGRGVEATRDQVDGPAAKQEPQRQEQQQVADKEKPPEPGADEDAGGAPGQRGSGATEDAGKKSGGHRAMRVVITVRDRPSWLLIQADGETAYEQVAQPGFSQSFEAGRQVYIKCGDAGAVNVQINGQDLGLLGPEGTIIERSYTLKGAG